MEARIDDRLLAEAGRCLDARRSDGDVDLSQVDHDELSQLDDESALICFAKFRREAPQIDEGIQRTRRVLAMVVLGILLVAALAGIGAARAALAPERSQPVNIFWLLGGVLGGQTLLLLLWFVLMLLGPRVQAATTIGGLAFGVSRWLMRREHDGGPGVAAMEAVAKVIGTGAIARWTLAVISHAAWTVFNVACLVAVILLLSARQYNFCWESTILTSDSYVSITKSVAGVPRALGFATPDEGQITAAQFDPRTPADFPEQDDATRAAWSSMLIGAIVIYGFAPRFLLVALALGLRRTAISRYRLDLNHPGHVRMLRRLRRRVSDGEDDRERLDDDLYGGVGTAEAIGAGGAPPAGPPAIVGLEIAVPRSGWPPPCERNVCDHGVLDERRQVQELVGTIRQDDTEPVPFVIVCDLTSTPDRGMGHLLKDLRAAVIRSPYLVVTGGQHLRDRVDSEQAEARIRDWHSLAGFSGIEPSHVLEIDLDHLTDTSLARWRELLRSVPPDRRSRGGTAPHLRRLEQAFSAIESHAARWDGEVTFERQSVLAREITSLYRQADRRWTLPVNVDWDNISDSGAMRDTIVDGVNYARRVMPPGLLDRPEWMAAGAVAGALGCVAAAMLISPVAIASLPVWSVIGAAVGAFLPRRDETEQPREDETTFDDAVRSAAVLALLLELQGRSETVITRVLEKSLPEERPPFEDMDIVRAWLAELRHRFDVALSEEEEAQT